MANVYIDTSDLKELSRKLEKCPKEMYAATASAMNRAITHGKKVTNREVHKEYYLKQSVAKQAKLKKARPSVGGMTASLKFSGSTLPAHIFKHKVARNRYRSPVTLFIKKSNGGQTHIGSSPAMFRGYEKKIMIRDSGQRGIKTAHTLSVPQMISNDEVSKVIVKEIQDKLLERMEHEVNWRLGKL